MQITPMADRSREYAARCGRVVGLAASDLLYPDQPRAPQNRRITITVLTHEAEERLMGKRNTVLPTPEGGADRPGHVAEPPKISN